MDICDFVTTPTLTDLYVVHRYDTYSHNKIERNSLSKIREDSSTLNC